MQREIDGTDVPGRRAVDRVQKPGSGVSVVHGRMRWLVMVPLLVGLSAPGVSLGDPGASLLGRLPVCGDAGDAGGVRLRCPDFEPLPEVEVFRVPGAGPVDLTFDFVFAEAARPNELGVFRVDDARGPVASWSPAEPEYIGAALRRATILFQAGSRASTADVTMRVAGGDFLVFFIVNNGTVAELLASNPTNALDKEPKAYFSIARLNPDPNGPTGGDHFVGFTGRTLPLTQFGFEDLTVDSDWDFDDVVYTVFASLQPPRCEGADRDGDGVPDVCDGCPGIPNPDQSDVDGDLVDDACDVCTLIPDFAQGDVDGDGLGDACSLEQCADGRDNDGNGLVDVDDPWCAEFVVEGTSRPRGVRPRGRAVVRGAPLRAARRSVLVGGRPARVERWRRRSVRFVVPRLEPGVYPVQLVRDGQHSNRVELFVAPRGQRGAAATRRRLVGALDGTSWWRFFDAVRHAEPSLANAFRLDAALRDGEAAPVVLSVIRNASIAPYGTSPDEYVATARRLDDCVQRYVLQMPDDVLATQLRCARYPGRPAVFRLLPADLQLRILNQPGEAQAASGCFPTSSHAAECRRALRAGGVGDGALAVLGFRSGDVSTIDSAPSGVSGVDRDGRRSNEDDGERARPLARP